MFFFNCSLSFFFSLVLFLPLIKKLSGFVAGRYQLINQEFLSFPLIVLLDFLGRAVVSDGSHRWPCVDSFTLNSSIHISLVEEASKEDKVRKVHEQRHLDVVFADVARFAVLLQLKMTRSKNKYILKIHFSLKVISILNNFRPRRTLVEGAK